MKSLSKTETPIFLSVVCFSFLKAIFLTFTYSNDNSQAFSLGSCVVVSCVTFVL